MLVSPPLADMNKKVVIGLATTLWGAVIFAHSFATGIHVLYFLAAVMGAAQGSLEACLYSIIGDLFAPKHRIRAYVLYSFFGLAFEPMKFAIPNIITMIGWKDTWFVLGAITMFFGLLFLFTVKVPVAVNNLEKIVDCPIERGKITEEIRK